jgi:class 3 adenylate cyclase
VSAYLGDGILVLFGDPHAHEDDPERAVRAGSRLPPP